MRHTSPRLSTLVLTTAIALLALNMFLPSLAHIAQEFEVDYGVANLSIAGFLGISAVLQLAIGPMSDRYGRRPLILWALVIFTVASIGAALAQNIWVFLGFRLLQSVMVVGSVVPRAAVRDMYDTREAAQVLGYVAMAMALAPMLGPMVGGLLDLLFGWRASFWLYTVMGGAIFWLSWNDFSETNTNRAASISEQIRRYPLLFSSRRFWGYSVCAAFSVGGFFSFITGAPLVAIAWFDLNAGHIGIGVGIISLGFLVGNYISARLSLRVPLTTLILYGRVSAIVGPVIGLLIFAIGQGTPVLFFCSAIFVGLGNGLTLANANTGVMSVRPELAGSAAGVSGALSVGVGAMLTSLTGAMVGADNAPFAVLGIMLCCGVLALCGALYVRWVDRCEVRATAQG